MLKVKEILRVKGHTLYTGTPDMPVSDAIAVMGEFDIGSLVIMDHGRLAGLLTFREIMKLIRAHPEQFGTMAVSTIMNSTPVIVTPDTDAGEVQRLMLDKHARYIPVMDDATLLGVISFYDMAKALVEAQQFENDMLKAYIRDWPSPDPQAASR